MEGVTGVETHVLDARHGDRRALAVETVREARPVLQSALSESASHSWRPCDWAVIGDLKPRHPPRLDLEARSSPRRAARSPRPRSERLLEECGRN